MNKDYKVTVNNAFDFKIDADAVSNFDALQVSESKYHVLEENLSHKAEITIADFNNKSYQVKVNKNTYNINIYSDLYLLINDMGFTVGASKQINSIKAPMPGLILEINIEIGQSVKENDILLILEAMKMENSITSPRDGIIKSISIKKGDAVEKNQLLIEFDDDV